MRWNQGNISDMITLIFLYIGVLLWLFGVNNILGHDVGWWSYGNEHGMIVLLCLASIILPSLHEHDFNRVNSNLAME